MDLFTEKANSIIKSIKPVEEKSEGAIVYSSEEEEVKYMKELEQKKKQKDQPKDEDAEQLTKDEFSSRY